MSVRNLVIISDTHCGCRLGLCPGKGVAIDEDGFYAPSRLQKVVWSWWEEFWGEFIPKATKGEPFDLLHNGDGVDGAPHHAITGISQNPSDQLNIALACLREPVRQCFDSGGKYYHIRGTEAHVGKSGSQEEELAKQLGAVKNSAGQHARYEIWYKMGKHLVHCLHHIGTTSSAAHESSAVNAELSALFTESARWGERRPSVIVRSHRHRAIEIRLPTESGFVTSCVTPAWQLKTPFAFKIAGARLAPPQIGGVLIRLDSDGNPYTQMFVRSIKRDRPT